MADRMQEVFRESEAMANALAAAVSPRVGPGGLVTVRKGVFCRVLLMLRGIETTQVARDLGVTLAAVNNCVYGSNPKCRSRRIEAHLADLLGVPAGLLFEPRGVSKDSIDQPEEQVNGCDDPACRHAAFAGGGRG